jgi:SAM-dependent methyltransferase
MTIAPTDILREPRTQPVKNCPLCNSGQKTLLFKTADKLHGIPGEYSYQKCRACQTVFQDPMIIPEDLHLCYPTEYYTHDIELKEVTAVVDEMTAPLGFKENLRQNIMAAVKGRPTKGLVGMCAKVLSKSRTMRERAFYVSEVDPYHQVLDELILRSDAPARGLEIGCGGGQLLYALQKAGWQMDGVEWDAVAAEKARHLTKSQIFTGDFRQAELPLRSYQMIVLHHVFEHLYSPREAFERIFELLKPNGTLILVYPNPKSLGARIWKGNWFPWEVPRHLIIPPIKAVENFVAAMPDVWMKPVKRHTLSRAATGLLSYSRSYTKGILPDQSSVTALDYFLSLIEKTATALGIQFGEESVIVFEKVGDNAKS